MQIKLILALLTVVLVGMTPGTAYEQVQSVQSDHILVIEPKPDPLDSVIKHLSWCESRDNEYAVNWNDGGSPSYGRFQIKETTWHYFLDKYGLFPDVERAERMNLIYDGIAQETATRRVLEDGAWEQWYNCLKGLYGAK